MFEINFDASKKDSALISQIIKRAKEDLLIKDLISLQMDLTACHLNGTPLDLKRLLEFDSFNFSHDIYGIINHIDRNDGKIKRYFLPRCFKKELQPVE